MAVAKLSFWLTSCPPFWQMAAWGWSGDYRFVTNIFLVVENIQLAVGIFFLVIIEAQIWHNVVFFGHGVRHFGKSLLPEERSVDFRFASIVFLIVKNIKLAVGNVFLYIVQAQIRHNMFGVSADPLYVVKNRLFLRVNWKKWLICILFAARTLAELTQKYSARLFSTVRTTSMSCDRQSPSLTVSLSLLLPTGRISLLYPLLIRMSL